MLTISKSKLKAQMLKIFREIEQTGEGVIVTDNNRPVLRIIPIPRKFPAAELFARFQNRIVFHEDPDAPTEAEWSEA
jgi:antitoxin (DNA-binding transcriptional repressor) of toxin-antitoxin stability system